MVKIIIIFGDWVELRASHLQSRHTLLEPHLQSIFLWSFWRWGLENYLPGLPLNLDPPALSLPRSQDYRCETPALGMNNFFLSPQIWLLLIHKLLPFQKGTLSYQTTTEQSSFYEICAQLIFSFQ
jgi:hypothetical protein